MVSLINGLSALGQGVSAFAGTAGLELQKSQLANQSAILADQLATKRELNVTQPFAKSQLDTSEAGANTRNAATNATSITTNAATNATSSSNNAATNATSLTTNAATNAGALERTQLEVNKPTGELQMARALAGPNATQDQLQDALTTVLSGRAKFTFSPTTQVDPDDPSKVISGVNRQNTRTGDVDFLPTGTNPNKPGIAGGMGNRSEVYFKRVTVAANEAAQAAQNIMELPSGSDAGWFAGHGAPHGLLGAAKETLTNALTTQGVQDYNTMVPGIGRSLAAIETGGLAPSGSISSSMEGLILKAGDSEMTKMRKMAELRQIVEKGMEPNLVDPKIPDVQKAQVRDIITQIQTAIPFTHHDITTLQQSANPSMTMADVVKARGIGAGATQQSPAPAFTVPDEGSGSPYAPQASAGATAARPPATAPKPPAAAIPPWAQPGDQYNAQLGLARRADGTTYGAPK
jgi:hypothetical protein